MNGMVRNLLLVTVLMVLVALHWAVLPDPSRRNYEFLPDMMESIPRNAQAHVPALADGTVPDLRPPEGSIARGYLPLGYGATPEEALRAGVELSNPFADDELDAVTRGEFIYTNFCVSCHGPAGAGDGPATKRGVPPPPSLLLEHAREMPDGQMFHVISLGQANMASYASQVERQDRWKVIRYLRTLQAAPDTANPVAPVAPVAEEGI